jgi:hypothetical protein
MMESEQQESHERREQELQDDADRIQEPSDNLEEDIEDTRDDWHQKTQTESVPGAMELPDEDDEEEPNRFEYEERSVEGPSSLDDSGAPADQGDDEDSDDDDS